MKRYKILGENIGGREREGDECLTTVEQKLLILKSLWF